MTRTDPSETATARIPGGLGLPPILTRGRYPSYLQLLKEVTDMPENGLPSIPANTVVAFTKDGASFSHTYKKGELAVTADSHKNMPDVVMRDGHRITVSRADIEEARGSWVPLTNHDAPSVVYGETLVRTRHELYGGDIYVKGGIHVAMPPTNMSVGEVVLKRRNSSRTDAFPARHFDVWVPETREQRAMSTATGLEYLRKFADLGVAVSIRSRSWDTQGRFVALELRDGTGAVGRKLYTPKECDEALREADEKQPATDVVAVSDGLYFRFHPSPGVVLIAPDGTERWSLGNINSVKGVVRQGGKKYRLCVEVVTRTVEPIFKG